MQKCGIVIIVAFFMFSIQGSKAKTLHHKSLSDEILVFICDEIDGVNDIPLIFINNDESWSLPNFQNLSVNKIENGFKFKSIGDKEGFGFLKKNINLLWNYEYLDQKGFYETTCKSQDQIVEMLIENIIPKIITKGDLLINKSKLEAENINNSNEKNAIELALEALEMK